MEGLTLINSMIGRFSGIDLHSADGIFDHCRFPFVDYLAVRHSFGQEHSPITYLIETGMRIPASKWAGNVQTISILPLGALVKV